jgi:hypothetical protein
MRLYSLLYIIYRHVTNVFEIKVLAIWLDHNLILDCHVGYLIVKLSKHCFAIKTIKSFVNKNIIKIMYFAYLHSSWKYGVLFWGTLFF